MCCLDSVLALVFPNLLTRLNSHLTLVSSPPLHLLHELSHAQHIRAVQSCTAKGVFQSLDWQRRASDPPWTDEKSSARDSRIGVSWTGHQDSDRVDQGKLRKLVGWAALQLAWAYSSSRRRRSSWWSAAVPVSCYVSDYRFSCPVESSVSGCILKRSLAIIIRRGLPLVMSLSYWREAWA